MAGSSGMPSLVRGLPSDSEEFSAFFNELLHKHNSSSSASCITSKPKTFAPPCLSPPPGAAGFFRSEDPNRFPQLGNHTGSGHAVEIGIPVAPSDAVADSSSTFDFSDPYAFVKEATETELFSGGVEESDANICFKEHSISPENILKNGEASELPSKPVPSRTLSKRSRAAEVHNLTEKRRRSRINEKMKALQNLIPNSNKTDKASMLDEAIDYLKQLQLQLQMLMIRNGLSLHPMCLPAGVQPMRLPQTELNFDEGNRFQKSTSGIASSANAESLVGPTFSATKHCGISNQSVVIPSLANIITSDTSSSFQPSDKDALCGSMPQLLLDTTKIGKNPSPDVS